MLPDGWEMIKTIDGGFIYVDQINKIAQWDRPKNSKFSLYFKASLSGTAIKNIFEEDCRNLYPDINHIFILFPDDVEKGASA